LTYPRAEICSG